MEILDMFYPTESMNLMNLNNPDYFVKVTWTHDLFEDYKSLAYNYYECGHRIFEEVLNHRFDHFKSDMWFLAGIFLLRQSIELGIKALICRVYNNNDAQSVFIINKHNLEGLYNKYCENSSVTYLTSKEQTWLSSYLSSLEDIDQKSDVFRFPFKDCFLAKYKDKYLSINNVANNMIVAFSLVGKQIQRSTLPTINDETINNPSFFIFADSGYDNCYLSEFMPTDGFYKMIGGYKGVLEYIFSCDNLPNDIKFYPLMFMLRHTIELALKRMLYIPLNGEKTMLPFQNKRKSHLIKKDFWRNIKDVIVFYSDSSIDDDSIIDSVDNLINQVSALDKNGDRFRYPTSYSFEYYFDGKNFDVKNLYECQMAIINFLDGCYWMLENIAEYQIDQ